MIFLTDIFRTLCELLPSYAWLPIALCVTVNFLVFCGTRVVTKKKPHFDFSCAVDDRIPFWPPIVTIYVLAFVQWIVGYIMIGRAGRELCFTYTSGDLIAKLICAVCFLVIPTSMVRPELHAADFFTWLTNIVYTMDSPDNLFPSIHCLESWIVWRATLEMPDVPAGFKWGMFIMTVLVCASTVLLKQHVFVDIIAGITVAELGIQIAHHTGISHVLLGWTDTVIRLLLNVS